MNTQNQEEYGRADGDRKTARDEITKQRYADISVACDTFVGSTREQAKNIPGIKEVNCDSAILFDVVKSMYDDIWRYKDYHLDDPDQQKSNAIKRAAYLTKWLVKLRPIFVKRDAESFAKNDWTHLINESFAIFLSLIYIAVDLKVEAIKLTKEKTNDLIYDLHYRELSDDALLSIYGMIADSAQEKRIVEVSLGS